MTSTGVEFDIEVSHSVVIPLFPLCGQISMSVNDQASVAQASATTPLETTPASARWTTCKSMEATTAWVRLLSPAVLASRCGNFVSDLISCARRHEEELLLQELLLWQQNVWRRAELQHDQKDVLLLLQHRPRVEQTLWTVSCAQHRWALMLAVYASSCMFTPKNKKWFSINSHLFMPAQMNLRSSVAVRDQDITLTSPLDGSSVRTALLKVYVIERKILFTSYCLFLVC